MTLEEAKVHAEKYGWSQKLGFTKAELEINSSIKEERKERVWIMWMRDKGTFSIAHLMKKTGRGIDTTICGMEYPSNTLKKIGGVDDLIRCSDCAKGKYNKSDLRSSEPI
jgi:hypothetical protein